MSEKKLNRPGDVLRHEKLGPGEWIVVSAVVAGAGTSYRRSYPDAWRLRLRKLTPDGTIDWAVPETVRFQDTEAFSRALLLPYVEPVKNDRNRIGLMGRQELVAYLRWMASVLEANDSLKGSINYELSETEEYLVRAAVRYGKTTGRLETSIVGQ